MLPFEIVEELERARASGCYKDMAEALRLVKEELQELANQLRGNQERNNPQ